MQRVRIYWFVIITVFVLIMLFFIIGLYEAGNIAQVVSGCKSEKLDDAAKFGDSAGALNALFSALAFGGVLVTIIWQVKLGHRQQISAQRNQFVTVFFNMTNTFEKLVESLSVTVDKDSSFKDDSGKFQLTNTGEFPLEDYPLTPTIDYKGREVFYYIYCVAKTGNNTFIKAIAKRNNSYEKLTDVDILHHYFRYLYHIIKYIDNSKLITEEEKYDYASMFRAHLSKYELLILFYDALSSYGFEKLKPLLEKYAFFKNLDISGLSVNEKKYYENIEELEHPEGDRQHYAISAFSHVRPNISIGGRIKRAGYNLIAYGLCPLLICYLFHDLWNSYIADIILVCVPTENRIILGILIALCILFLGDTYRYRNSTPRNSAVFTINNIVALDAIAISAIEMFCHDHEWIGCSGISYFSIIPLTALLYLPIANWNRAKYWIEESRKLEKVIQERKKHRMTVSNVSN